MGTDIYKYKVIRDKRVITSLLNILRKMYSLNPPEDLNLPEGYKFISLTELEELHREYGIYPNTEYHLNIVRFKLWLLENNLPVVKVPVATFDFRKFFEEVIGQSIDDFELINSGTWIKDENYPNIIFSNNVYPYSFSVVFQNKNKETVIVDTEKLSEFYFYAEEEGIFVKEVGYQRRKIKEPCKLAGFKKVIFSQEDFNFIKTFFVENKAPMKKWKINGKDEFIYISE